MRALVTGATGFVGRRLLEFLDDPIVLSRDAERAKKSLGGKVRTFAWDPNQEPAPTAALEQVDTIFHLAGDPVADGRWNDEKRRRIRESRTVGTANLVRGIAACGVKPKTLVSASAIGYYGSRGDEILDESSAGGDDFLAQVCSEWEREAVHAESFGVRTSMARIGVVLGRGGALQKMLLPFKLGLGGRLGAGRQWMSWVHVDDVVGMLLHGANDSMMRGPFNAVGPVPVTNREFTKALGRALHRPTLFPVPAFMLKLVIGDFAEILLASQRCVPTRMQAAGYRFKYSTVDEALVASVGASAAKAAS